MKVSQFSTSEVLAYISEMTCYVYIITHLSCKSLQVLILLYLIVTVS